MPVTSDPGSFQDRMDILLKFDTVALDGETAEHNETSASIHARIATARKRQYELYGKDIINASVPNETILGNSELTEDQ